MLVCLLHLLVVIFSALPVVFLAAVAWVMTACMSSSPTCGDLFCTACSLSCSSGLGDDFCTACSYSCTNTSANGSISSFLPGVALMLVCLLHLLVVIFSALPVVFLAAVAWVMTSALPVVILAPTLQQMDLYLTPMCHLLPQSSITGNWILQIVFCPMPCSSAALSVPCVDLVRPVLHLENTMCA